MILKCIVIVKRNRALGTDMFTAALSFVTVRENVLVPTELDGKLLSTVGTVVFDIRLAVFAKLVLNSS